MDQYKKKMGFDEKESLELNVEKADAGRSRVKG